MTVGEEALCVLKLKSDDGNEEMVSWIKKGRNVVFITPGAEIEGGELLVEIIGQDAGLVWVAWRVIDPNIGDFLNHYINRFDNVQGIGFFIEVVE